MYPPDSAWTPWYNHYTTFTTTMLDAVLDMWIYTINHLFIDPKPSTLYRFLQTQLQWHSLAAAIGYWTQTMLQYSTTWRLLKTLAQSNRNSDCAESRLLPDQLQYMEDSMFTIGHDQHACIYCTWQMWQCDKPRAMCMATVVYWTKLNPKTYWTFNNTHG